MAGSGRPVSQPHSPPDTPKFRQLWQEQEGLCALCGKPMPHSRAEVAHSTLWKKWRPTFDHIVPRAHEGSDEITNLRLAHAICNKRRGTGRR
jgi:5-methylcytosine-specific restriction endonuclease McrA